MLLLSEAVMFWDVLLHSHKQPEQVHCEVQVKQ